MKTFLFAFLALTSASLAQLGTQAQPEPIGNHFGLAWDMSPEPSVDHYTIYEWKPDASGTRTPVAIAGFEWTVPAQVPVYFDNVTPGIHVYTVTASNPVAESLHSAQLFAEVFARPGAPTILKLVPPKKLAQLDNKLRVQEKHFVMFRQGVAPDYPQRILASRQLLELPMTKKDATHP